MNCREALQLMYEYLDNELTSDVVKKVRNHLAACEHCFDRFEFEKLLNDCVSRRGQISVDPEPLKLKVMQGIRELDQEESTKGFFSRFRPYVAAAAVLVLILIGMNFVLNGRHSALHAEVKPLVDHHEKCVHGSQNGDLAHMSEADIRTCIAGFIADPEILLRPIPDRHAVFGEIVRCPQCKAAHITYEYAGTHVSVYVFEKKDFSPPRENQKIKTEKHEYYLVPFYGMNVVYWQCKGCWCAAVAEIDPDGMISFLSAY